MKSIGVTGPIGAGKSTIVAALTKDPALAQDLGGAVLSIDADAVLRDARRSSPALQRAIGALVPEAQRSDGSIDTVRLASVAFDRPEVLAALERLQWPIARESIRAAREKGEASGAALLLVEAISLIDSGLAETLDGILLVDAPRPIREARLAARGMSVADFERRERIQAGLSERVRAAGARKVDAQGTIGEAAGAAANALRLLCSQGEADTDPSR